MLPYFQQPGLGPIHAFGVLVVIGILLGGHLLRRRAAATGLDPARADQLLGWLLVPGFLGAHLVDRLVYFPGKTLADPLSLLRLWDGLSSSGGFLGAVLGAALWARRHAGGRTWGYLDAVAYAFPVGWFFGRLGCFVAYDHPGLPTAFVLGQRYSDGVVRHNLGLEEALLTVPIGAVLLLAARRPRGPGFLFGLLAVLYAPVRFGLDFLRAVDTRYLGLTPAQHAMIALLVVGALLLVRSSRLGHGPASVATRPGHEGVIPTAP